MRTITVNEEEAMKVIQDYIYEKKGVRITIMPLEYQVQLEDAQVVLFLFHSMYDVASNYFLTKQQSDDKRTSIN